MIKQAAVKIDGERVNDGKQILQEGFSAVIQVGKRKFVRVKLTA
jgi:tyrosyl-tRNA synthetase